jgi:hypothetical protein
MVMMMSVYTSMAHAALEPHLRPVLAREYANTDPGSFRRKCWDWALLSYGRGMYTLGERIGVVPSTAVHGMYAPKTHSYPTVTVARAMLLGISPLELYAYPTISEASTSYTPIHVATALLRYAPERYRSMAEELVTPEFLREHARRPEPNPGSIAVNPYTPRDVGLDFGHLDIAPGDTVDEVGNLAWFSDEYADVYFKNPSVHALPALLALNACHDGRWTPLLRRYARASLLERQQQKNVPYRHLALLLRTAPQSSAESYLSRAEGVKNALHIVRADTDPRNMAKGLGVLATTDTRPIQELWSYLGRALTIEDIRRLTPQRALEVCYRAPLEALSGLKEYTDELGAMFVGARNLDLSKASKAFSEHNERPRSWVPCTAQGITKHANVSTREELVANHARVYQPFVLRFVEAYEWRNDLLQAVGSDTAVLGLLHTLGGPEGPIPRIAIENVLRSHPDVTRLLTLMQQMPLHIREDLKYT